MPAASSRTEAEEPLAASAPPTRRYAMAAGAGAVAAGVAEIFLTRAPSSQYYESGLGGIRNATLQDRSIVALNAGTRLSTAFHARTRSVTLERGEAWFHVRKDASRPFVVAADDVRVMAVGTAFSVRMEDAAVRVLVSEGSVRVWKVGRETDARILAARSMIAVAEGDVTTRLTTPDLPRVERALAWRDKRIELDGDTLAFAVEQFNHSNVEQIRLDPLLSDHRLYGTFQLFDPEGFARSAAAAVGADVSVTSGSITIVRGGPAATPAQGA